MSVDLKQLEDHELAGIVREREVAFQDALAEVSRRAATYGIADWNEREAAALLAQKRADIEFDVTGHGIHTLPPPLFRMGYEWAALSILRILDGILARPSADIVIVSDFQHVGKGLFKQIGQARPSDLRRRAARDLIELIEQFGRDILRGQFFVSKRKNHYVPEDDAELALIIAQKNEGLSGALFR